MKAREMMHSPDADIHVDHNLCEAQVRFDRYGRDRLLVIDGDEVVGVLHRDDLPEDRESWEQLTVQEIMPAIALPTCGPDDSLEKVRTLLQDHAFLLVLDGEREILGIIEQGRQPERPDGPGLTPRGGASPDPTGGRAAMHDRLEVYSDKPHLRRLREER